MPGVYEEKKARAITEAKAKNAYPPFSEFLKRFGLIQAKLQGVETKEKPSFDYDTRRLGNA